MAEPKEEVSMSEEFQKGDVVQLKSGGPTMTVQNLGDYTSNGIEDGALCVWFDGKKKHAEVFDRAVLKKCEPAKSQPRCSLESRVRGLQNGLWLSGPIEPFS